MNTFSSYIFTIQAVYKDNTISKAVFTNSVKIAADALFACDGVNKNDCYIADNCTVNAYGTGCNSIPICPQNQYNCCTTDECCKQVPFGECLNKINCTFDEIGCVLDTFSDEDDNVRIRGQYTDKSGTCTFPNLTNKFTP